MMLILVSQYVQDELIKRMDESQILTDPEYDSYFP